MYRLSGEARDRCRKKGPPPAATARAFVPVVPNTRRWPCAEQADLEIVAPGSNRGSSRPVSPVRGVEDRTNRSCPRRARGRLVREHLFPFPPCVSQTLYVVGPLIPARSRSLAALACRQREPERQGATSGVLAKRLRCTPLRLGMRSGSRPPPCALSPADANARVPRRIGRVRMMGRRRDIPTVRRQRQAERAEGRADCGDDVLSQLADPCRTPCSSRSSIPACLASARPVPTDSPGRFDENLPQSSTGFVPSLECDFTSSCLTAPSSKSTVPSKGRSPQMRSTFSPPPLRTFPHLRMIAVDRQSKLVAMGRFLPFAPRRSELAAHTWTRRASPVPTRSTRERAARNVRRRKLKLPLVEWRWSRVW